MINNIFLRFRRRFQPHLQPPTVFSHKGIIPEPKRRTQHGLEHMGSLATVAEIRAEAEFERHTVRGHHWPKWGKNR